MKIPTLILLAAAIIIITSVILVLFFSPPELEPMAKPIIMPIIINPSILFEEATVCEPLSVQVEFKDQDNTVVNHVNYDIKAIQNENTLLVETGAHRHQGQNPTHETAILLGVFPIDFIVTFQGIGHDEDLIGPIDKEYTLTVTPNTPSEINCELLHEEKDKLPQ